MPPARRDPASLPPASAAGVGEATAHITPVALWKHPGRSSPAAESRRRMQISDRERSSCVISASDCGWSAEATQAKSKSAVRHRRGSRAVR
jgi:hypothetical protein